MPGRRILRGVPACRVKVAAIQDWSFNMAAKCDICGKGPQFGNNVSHANNTTRRRWNVNLHPVKAVVAGASKRIRVCSGCIKTGKVVKG
jgi:large subunit ribosomal protein L28